MMKVSAIPVSHPDGIPHSVSVTFHPVVGDAVAVFRLTSVGGSGTFYDWYIGPVEHATTKVIRPTFGHADGHTTEVTGWGVSKICKHTHRRDLCDYLVEV